MDTHAPPLYAGRNSRMEAALSWTARYLCHRYLVARVVQSVAQLRSISFEGDRHRCVAQAGSNGPAHQPCRARRYCCQASL